MKTNLLGVVAALVLSTTSASADIVTLTVTGTIAPYQFGSLGYQISPVIDTTGLFGQAGADLAGNPFTVVWTGNTQSGSLSAVLTIDSGSVTFNGPGLSSYFFNSKIGQTSRTNENITVSIGGLGNVAINTYINSTVAGIPGDIRMPYSYTLNPATDNNTCCFPPAGISGGFELAPGPFPNNDLDGYFYGSTFTWTNLTNPNFIDSTFVVPGPIVGAGLPGILFAGGGLLAWRRRKRKYVAAIAAA